MAAILEEIDEKLFNLLDIRVRPMTRGGEADKIGRYLVSNHFTRVVDPNQLCTNTDLDLGSHVHMDPDPATEPIRIRINPNLVSTESFQICRLLKAFTFVANVILWTKALFLNNFKVSVTVLAIDSSFQYIKV